MGRADPSALTTHLPPHGHNSPAGATKELLSHQPGPGASQGLLSPRRGKQPLLRSSGDNRGWGGPGTATTEA